MGSPLDALTGAEGRRRVALLSGLGGVLALVVVLWLVLGGDDESAQTDPPAEVGGCVAAPGDGGAVGCGEPEASYRVAAEAADGCDPAEVEHDGLCLDWNAAEGDCFRGGSGPAEKVDCAAAEPGVQRVVRVGEAGEACATGSLPRLNERRGTLLCLTDVE